LKVDCNQLKNPISSKATINIKKQRAVTNKSRMEIKWNTVILKIKFKRKQKKRKKDIKKNRKNNNNKKTSE